MTQFNKRTCRPRDQVAAIAKAYPQAWAQIDEFRADRGKGLPAWADWCFIPMAATYAIASAQHGTNRLNTHIRRAHWHSYWVGSVDDKKINVKWLPPIAVNLDDDALPAVVRKVE